MSRPPAHLIVFRVCVVAGVFVLVVGRPPHVSGDSNISRAKLDVKTLEQAVTLYKTMHSAWPDSLQILAERQPDGGRAFVHEKLLLDPWGRPYHYDPRQLHPGSHFPLIWSDGVDPTNPDGRITNWAPPTSVWDAGTSAVVPWARLVAAAAGVLGLAFVLLRHGNKCPGDKRMSTRARSLEILVVLASCGLLALSCALCTPRMLE